jgi:tetratricopeptide (TPR) repeat protein/glutathione synthase/RimK-type ligase-like ATP-grasp enzyme
VTPPQPSPRPLNGARHLPAALSAELVALGQAGRWPQLQVAAGRVTQRFARNPLGWRALGVAHLQLGRAAQAAEALAQAARLAPGDAELQNDLGAALLAQGDRRAAADAYRHAIALNPMLAVAWSNLAGVLCDLGDTAEALGCARQAVALDPRSAAAYNNLAIALRDSGMLPAAESAWRAALALQPDRLDALVNLATLLADLARVEEAKSGYRRALTVDPGCVAALIALAKLLNRLQSDDAEAMDCLQRVLALRPDDADAHAELGNILMRQGQTDAALARYRRGQALQPFITWRVRQPPPAFSALFLDTPLAGSTPVDYLAGQADYDRHFFCLMPGGLDDPELLRGRADVVFNMIADPDSGAAVLPMAMDLVERLGRPVVNHPRAVLGTDRAALAQRLARLDGCVAPRTLRVGGAVLAGAAGGLAGCTPPLLVRRAGTHGGDAFERCADWAAAAALAARAPGAEYYVSEYVDYRSADGWFRKYRVIFIDGRLYPYHLAIHDDWKVHHFRTAMSEHDWMRREEARFTEALESVFDPVAQQALRGIAAATGLDYGGIDCARDAEGRIVVFEANASMLVHDEKNAMFAYKNPAISRIKAAFDTLLAKRQPPS